MSTLRIAIANPRYPVAPAESVAPAGQAIAQAAAIGFPAEHWKSGRPDA
jgi:hypothetical protein